jgi:tetratricopeptide (TPR) repeat protein
MDSPALAPRHDCPPAEVLQRYRDGRLSAEERNRLAPHLDVCPSCQAYLDELDQGDNQLAEIARHAPPPPPPIPNYEYLRDEYDFPRVVGRGGLGVVFLARYGGLAGSPPRAVKVVHTGYQILPRARERFLLEIEAVTELARQGHPGFVQIFECGEAGGCLYYVMEYVPGGNLQRLLQKYQPTPHEAAEWLLDLAQTMVIAHRNGIFHRDLKPSNVLVVMEQAASDTVPHLKCLKIADFSHARLIHRDSSLTQGEPVGTPNYMAPEQARGEQADARADVYGLCAILYEMLTGRPPFEAPSPLATLDLVRSPDHLPQSPAALRPGLAQGTDADLVSICMKGLEKDRDRRYKDVPQLAADLQLYLEGRPTKARPLRWPARLTRWARRRPALAGLASAVAFLGLLLLGAAALFWRADTLRRAGEAQAQANELLLTQRALDAEAERRRIAEESLTREFISAGDTLLAQGAPGQAREQYRRAVRRPDLAASQRLLLRARIVRTSAALDDMAAVKEELDALGREQHPSAETDAAYRFKKALYLLHRSMEESVASATALAAETNHYEQEAELLLRQAVEDKVLTEADRRSARGLLAQSADEALQRFREATEIEPFHVYANLYFVLTSILAGRLEEALPRLEIWLRMSPRNPDPVVYKAIVLTLMGKYAEAGRVMRELERGPEGARNIGKGTLAAYQAVLDTIQSIQITLVETPMDTSARLAFLGKLAGAVMRYNMRAPWGEEPAGMFRVPLTPAQRRSVGRFLKAVQTGMGISFTGWPGIADPRGGLKQLEAAGPFIPEGWRLYFRASFKANLKDQEGAAIDLEQAIDSPAIFSIRRFCLLSVANYKLKLASKNATPEQSLAEVRTLLRQAYGLGPMNAPLKEKYLDALIRSGDLEFAGDLARSWDNRKALERVQQLKHQP